MTDFLVQSSNLGANSQSGAHTLTCTSQTTDSAFTENRGEDEPINTLFAGPPEELESTGDIAEKDDAHINNLRQLLNSIQSQFKIVAAPKLASMVNWRGAVEKPIHRWFRYREAYSPDLITELKLGSRLLDPFCGCGSIMVGAAQTGRTSVGIDVNPIATFVAKTKLTPLSAGEVGQVATFLERFSEELGSREPWPAPALHIAGKVFEPEILHTLLQLRTALEAEGAGNRRIRNFLLLAWLSILEDVGSYFKEGNGIKYRNKKRLKTGYTRRPEGTWQLERFGPDQRGRVIHAYLNQLSTMISDTLNWKEGQWEHQEVIRGSALEMQDLLAGKEFDSVIFSPPYANRFDYFESMKVELWFGGFVSSYEDLNALRKASLRSHLGADLSRPNLEVPSLECLIDRMDHNASSWRMRVPSALRGYFDDMFQTLRHCRASAPEGRCYVVVGNSAFAGVIIPTDAIIAELGLRVGFSKARLMVVRHLTVAPQQRSMLTGLEEYMRESVVILE
jgi:hypothetical protein